MIHHGCGAGICPCSQVDIGATTRGHPPAIAPLGHGGTANGVCENVQERQEAEEAAEYARWSRLMTVESAGDSTAEAAAAAEARAKLCACIRERKVVRLEEVAAELGLRTKRVIEEIRTLEASGELTGVLDDRGKVRTMYCRCGWFLVVGHSCLSRQELCS